MATKFLKKEREKGFSLIELVIVVAVLAVLSAIALPTFNSIRIWLDETEAKVLTNNMLKSISRYNVKYGALPTSWTVIAEEYFPDLDYCIYENAIQRRCGTGVGIPVSGIDPLVNPLNCIVVTQASYEMCGRRSSSQFQIIMREIPAIESPSDRKSISGCFSSINGGIVIKQETRNEVWVDCLN